MASTDPIFGIVMRRVDNEPGPAIYADLDTVGIVGPADDADPDIFPLNEPVKFNSDNVTMIKAIGENGFITDAIRGINDQLADYQLAAQCVFVRTARGVNSDTNVANQLTIAHIMGDSALGTGIHALLLAPELINVTPRLICTPGYTGVLANGVDTITQVLPGSGYAEGTIYQLNFSGGGSNAVLPTAHAVGQADGSLGEAIIDSFGAWLTSPPTITADAPPVGSGHATATYTATMDTLANPIVASLPAVLDGLIGHAIVESVGTSQLADENWRETISHERLIPMSGGIKITDPETGNTLVRPVAPRVIGCMIRRDKQTGAPFHSAANQPVFGIIGPQRSIRFNIVDGANEGQELLTDNIGIVVRGEIGNDFAIANGGYVLIVTDNAGEDELWRFYNVMRGRDFIHLTLIRSMRYYLGRFNITAQAIQSIVNIMHNVLRDLKANDNLLGYRINFVGALNSADEIRKGNITISFAAEEPTVLRKITAQSARYRPAVEAMVNQLAGQLNLIG